MALLLGMLNRPVGWAQNIEKLASADDTKSYARVGLRFVNDYVYMGRTDSLQAPYLVPSFGYYHKSGLFVQGSFSYLTASGENRIDLYTLSGGYDYFGTRLSAGVSASGYFFSDKSYAVQSAMTGYGNAYIGYDFSLVEFYVDGSVGLSDQLDVFGGVELRRTVYAFNDRLLIIPSVYVNAGSQNYYNEYYATRNSKITKGKGYGASAGKGPGQVSTTTSSPVKVEEVTRFRILDYELSTMLLYKLNDFRFSFTPTYAIPVNAATVSVDDTVTFKESLGNIFFWSVGLGYTIQ